MLHLTPVKSSPSKIGNKVKDLNVKLLNLFDTLDEQQEMIKSLNKSSLDSAKGSSFKFQTPKSKIPPQLAHLSFTKIKPMSSHASQMGQSSTPELKNYTIPTLTNRFSEYRQKNKSIYSEEDEKFKLEEKQENVYQISIPISAMKKTKENNNEETGFKPRILDFSECFPKTAANSRKITIDFGAEKDFRPKTTVESKRKRNETPEQKKVKRSEQTPEKGNSTYRSTKPISSYTETHGPWKFHGHKKTDLSQYKLVRGQSVGLLKNKGNESSIFKLQPTISLESKYESHNISRISRSITTKGNVSSFPKEFRIKKVVGESTLNPPKVTTNQKQRLSDFLQDEFVEEVITNKHNVRSMYDGEALTNLNELKKVLNSHASIRATMYGPGAKKEVKNTRDAEFPSDVPRLRRFELSDPDGEMLGIRPKNIISEKAGLSVDKNEKNQNNGGEVEEPPKVMSQIEKKTLMTLKSAIDVQKTRWKQIRKAICFQLHKYSRLNISLSDLKNFNEIFPAKPYSKKGSYSFMRAVKAGDVLTVKDYLDQDKYFVFEYDPIKQTALHWAAKRGHTKIVNVLLEFGADTDALDMGGKTALYYAIKEKNGDIVGRLLFSKANPWSSKTFDYKEICDDGRCLKYLNKARQLAILLLFHAAKDRQALWEKEAKALIAPIDTDSPTKK